MCLIPCYSLCVSVELFEVIKCVEDVQSAYVGEFFLRVEMLEGCDVLRWP